MAFNQIEEDDYQSLLTGLVRGEYHLLLGAGASIGASGGDGLPLPSAPSLAKELVSEFRINTDGQEIDLREAYEIIENQINSKGQDRSKYFRHRFSNCSPSWQEALTGLIWKKIWTLNIDDVIERAYLKMKASAKQRAIYYNWNSLYREPDYHNNEVQVIHLHGYAPILDDNKSPIIFSIIEYFQAISSYRTWHRIFADEFLQRPFIIVGARLTDEYDLADVLRRGNQSKNLTGRPSLIILKDIPAYKKEQFRKFGLLPIESEAQAFFIKLTSDVLEVESRIAKTLPRPQLTSIPKEAKIFLQQFQALKVEGAPKVPRDHDFYQGDEPFWSDIINDLDARFELVDKILKSIDESKEISRDKPHQEIYCVSGPPGSGKSTLIFRVGRELLSQGYDVYLFRGEERLDSESTIWWLENSPKSVLLIDGVSDFSFDLGKLAIQCSDLKINLLAITNDRETRLQQVYQGIDHKFLIAGEEHKLYLLSDVDIERLLTKLRNARRLGIITRKSIEEQKKYFRKDSNRQLLVAMSSLEGGRGFIQRIKKEYWSDVTNPQLRSVYALCCITYNIGYPLPFGVVCSTLSLHSDSLSNALKAPGELSGLVYTDQKGLKPRHRVVASIIVNNILEAHDRFKLTRDLAITLSPYVTTHTITQRTLPYRITRTLMDQDIICILVGRRRARDWYTEIEKEYNWNARFWEQRALTEARNFNFPRARSYAEEALKIQRHPYTLNTLGSILTQMAIDHFEPGTKEARDIFWEGISYLRDSRKLGEGREHSYTTFFARTINYFRKLKENAVDDQRLSAEWQHWMNHARNEQIFRHKDLFERLQEYHSIWLNIAVGTTQN